MNTSSVTMIAASTSTLGALAGVSITTFFSRRSSEKQARMQTALKLAEFRQAWINALRDAMAEFASLGVTPHLQPGIKPEFYQLGTKIELMMNRDDPEYATLDGCMADYLMADTQEAKLRVNPEFVAVCQRVLKREWDRLRADLETIANSR